MLPVTTPTQLPLRLNDVAGEAALLGGGGAAILLQLAHPAVARGVARHSDFSERPLDRLFGTLDYVYTIAFGDEEMVASVVRRVNRAHGPVHGKRAEPAYNAVDPELQLWVAATLYYAAMQVQDRLLGGLDDASAEAVYLDYAALGARLQMPAELWPSDRDGFERYWEGMLAQLEPSHESRTVVQALMHPRTVPFAARAAMPLVRLVSTGLLPPAVRALHGLHWDSRRQLRFDRVFRITRFVYPRLPRNARVWPRERSLARVRRAMAEPRGGRR